MPVTYITSNAWDEKNNWTGNTGTTVHTDQYVGAVLDVGTETVQVMSDVWEDRRYALVWDVDRNDTRKIDISSEGTSGKVDATPETVALYRAKVYDMVYRRQYDHALNYRRTPSVGSTVTVKRGRQNVGSKGVVRVVKPMLYSMGYKSIEMNKLGVSTSDKTKLVTFKGKEYTNYVDMIWVWACNVEVDNPESLVDLKAVKASAERETNNIVGNLPGTDLPTNANRRLYNVAAPSYWSHNRWVPAH